ncbi:MAG: alkA [Nitrospira sp.]|jgi:DNA-3-methyladenine glycosylase II|nr:alkA [Nitrospira sp.]
MSLHSPEAAYLSKSEPVMRRSVEQSEETLSFESSARAASQRFSDSAAESILKRFIALFPGRRFHRPAEAPAMTTNIIRGTGLSKSC